VVTKLELRSEVAPMGVLGHGDAGMTEKHYAHLAPSYVAQTIRANFPVLGLADSSNVVRLRAPKSRQVW
jgi:hypothetical protein